MNTTNILANMIKYGLRFAMMYIAFVVTYWLVHIPILAVLGAMFHFDYELAVPQVNNIAYFPLWLFWSGPEMFFSHFHWYAADPKYPFWMKVVLLPVGGVGFLFLILWAVVGVPVWFCRNLYGFMRRMSDRR